MFSTTSEDGRLEFHLLPEDNYSAKIVFPTGVACIFPAADVRSMLEFYRKHEVAIMAAAEKQRPREK